MMHFLGLKKINIICKSLDAVSMNLGLNSNDSLISDSSQFFMTAPSTQKILLASNVVKSDPKIII